MPEHHRILVIAKQRAFDEEKWKQLLMAVAYLLHEQRKQRKERVAEQSGGSKADA